MEKPTEPPHRELPARTIVFSHGRLDEVEQEIVQCMKSKGYQHLTDPTAVNFDDTIYLVRHGKKRAGQCETVLLALSPTAKEVGLIQQQLLVGGEVIDLSCNNNHKEAMRMAESSKRVVWFSEGTATYRATEDSSATEIAFSKQGWKKVCPQMRHTRTEPIHTVKVMRIPATKAPRYQVLDIPDPHDLSRTVASSPKTGKKYKMSL
ncbi:hypothetical protein FGM00_11265 [Aggregatimonas sangjinii]|uniref:Uncharacterized protein n=1 Tax=Aggregatimonas sangjinii TaxID=2583587 RepID=A0A5B7SPZ2_9FLAO|nr:hypothetical protein [Aggregatimonas sangjinii]QCX00656.1 hypothetical protein FGM00_11265 [Aggregatimonas sangjinii]